MSSLKMFMTFSTLFKRILFLFLQENMRLMKALTERKYETCDYFVYVDLLLMIIVVFFVTIVQSLRGLEVSCRDIGSTYRWCKHRTCSFPRPTLVSWRYISFLID